MKEFSVIKITHTTPGNERVSVIKITQLQVTSQCDQDYTTPRNERSQEKLTDAKEGFLVSNIYHFFNFF